MVHLGRECGGFLDIISTWGEGIVLLCDGGWNGVDGTWLAG
jgi:hypothetical protein